jgi:hypothetical protein
MARDELPRPAASVYGAWRSQIGRPRDEVHGDQRCGRRGSRPRPPKQALLADAGTTFAR